LEERTDWLVETVNRSAEELNIIKKQLLEQEERMNDEKEFCIINYQV
jgi:hypothetical protein